MLIDVYNVDFYHATFFLAQLCFVNLNIEYNNVLLPTSFLMRVYFKHKILTVIWHVTHIEFVHNQS